jgi:NAD(P)-dependent dehydrogenase (short-subunit alcohol dehydrogenase family)
VTQPLASKVALVTGAAQGIGAAYARRLAQLGAHVVVADIDAAGAKSCGEEIAADEPGRAEGAALDITDPQASVELAGDITRRHGGIDILVNNAGLYRGLVKASAADIEIDYWRRQVDVNLSGTYFVTRAVIPHMVGRGWGRIVNQGSVGAYLARPGSLHYTVTKAAVHAMVKVLAKELGPYAITVNALAPGATSSVATLERMSPEHMREYEAAAAIGRMISPEDLADVLEFLCSDKSSSITGQTLVADGGNYFLG